MTEQFTEIVVGVAPEVENVTPQWVVAEEYEKLQARIEELENELECQKYLNDLHGAMGRLMAQCTPSRNRTTGFGARLGRQIDLLLGN